MWFLVFNGLIIFSQSSCYFQYFLQSKYVQKGILFYQQHKGNSHTLMILIVHSLLIFWLK